MGVSPWKTYKRWKRLVWSGRSRRIAKIVDLDNQARAQENGESPPPYKTPGGRSD